MSDKKQMKDMTPKEIVAELDKYIIGQEEAKKSVAIALRNRYRRSKLDAELREEVTPKNILMMGPTGVGKTEIARRLAKLMDAPFVKVEATKFTEVGYVGRDVESMIRDLVEASVRLVKNRKLEEKREIAEKLAEDALVAALVPDKSEKKKTTTPLNVMELFSRPDYKTQKEEYEESIEKSSDTKDTNIAMAREQVRKQLREGLLEDEIVEITVDVPMFDSGNLDVGGSGMSIAIGNIFGGNAPTQKKSRKMHVRDARKTLIDNESQKLIDMDEVSSEALFNAEENGIIFIDEIDKIASNGFKQGADVSRDGVQRDILPIVEGSVVNTKHGTIKTDHILFIGSGAFHMAKPSDLIPELQGRFPIRVNLKSLNKEDFKAILTVPQNALIKQNIALMATEGLSLSFDDEALEEIAEMAYLMNIEQENIGARRLHTILEKLLEEISFEGSDAAEKNIVIDREYVRGVFASKIDAHDLDRYIL